MSVKLIMTLEAELEKGDVDDIKTLKQDLEGELMKVKSGLYENRFYGSIVKVRVV